uniref:Uncharacterized protein n=1 Tax=Cajanus cajan TaxID=3821 RepID=A0A151QP42_CAJCA|nr:hypothetical protein KK1_047337 [Cajanus cajan]
MQRLLDIEAQIIQPHQERVETINISQGKEIKEISIDTLTNNDIRQRLMNLLKEYIDVFGWSYHDMSGLDPKIVEHILPLKEEFRPIKQKLRRVKLEWSHKIKEEVQKQIDVAFLIVPHYPEWLANIVPCSIVGDLVLKKLLPSQKDRIGKWMPNCEGPYMVKRDFSRGALILTNMDGKELIHLINANVVKKYYA